MINRESGVFQTTYEGDMALYTLPLAKNTAWVLVALLVLLPVPLMLADNDHLMSIVTTIALAGVGAIGLNILVGLTGQISIGHGAFMMVGAYTAAILSNRYETMPFFVGILAAGVTTMVVGTLFGLPSLRIKGLYLAIATLAAQFIIEWVIIHILPKDTIFVKNPELFGFVFNNEFRRYYLVLAVFLLGFFAAQNLVRSRVGRAFIAIRDRDIAAEIIGVNLFKYKLLAFAVSSFYAGVAGALWTYYLRIANYEQFILITSIEYLAMIIIGGLGSVIGAVFGAIFIKLFPIALSLVVVNISEGIFGVPYESVANFLANFELLLFGALIIFFLTVEPEGLARLWEHVKRYFRLWPYSY